MAILIGELKEYRSGNRYWANTSNNRQLMYRSGRGASWLTIGAPYVNTGSRWARLQEPKTSVTTRYTDSFSAIWSESYDGDSNVKPSQYTLGRLYQGRYGHHNTIDNIYYNPIYWGSQRSLIGFNVNDIQRKLSGATIQKVELYLNNEHFWYAKGGKASIVSHNFSNRPNKFNYVGSLTESSFTKGQSKWVTLPLSVGNQLKRGSVTGFGLFKNTNDLDYYGYFSGATSSSRPVLRVTYTKNHFVSGSGQEYLTNERTSNEPKYNTYTVKSGDTLWGISQRYNVTVSQLQSWNNLTSTLIHPGDVLRLYQESGTVSAPATTPKYTSVIAGEGLVQVTERLMRQGLLSQDFFEARRALMNLNGFTTSAPLLHPGDQVMYSRG